MELKIDTASFLDTVERIKRAVDEMTDEAFEACAQQMESYAKLNAPWQNRTGNARRSLTGVTSLEPLGVKEAAITGGMEYSPSLELEHDGRYSILFPTVTGFAPNVFGYMERLTEELGAFIDEGR